MEELIKVRNKIGSIPVMNTGYITDDNIALALASYFESLPECPTDDVNDEVGWSQWAIDKTHNVLDRIAKECIKYKGD